MGDDDKMNVQAHVLGNLSDLGVELEAWGVATRRSGARKRLFRACERAISSVPVVLVGFRPNTNFPGESACRVP